jgi:hypothetical protein
MNMDAYKRKEVEKELKTIINGETRDNWNDYAYRPSYEIEAYVKRLNEAKQRSIVIKLLDLAKSRGGTDIHSCLLNLNPQEHYVVMWCVGWPRVTWDTEEDIPLQEAVLFFLMHAWDKIHPEMKKYTKTLLEVKDQLDLVEQAISELQEKSLRVMNENIEIMSKQQQKTQAFLLSQP